MHLISNYEGKKSTFAQIAFKVKDIQGFAEYCVCG